MIFSKLFVFVGIYSFYEDLCIRNKNESIMKNTDLDLSTISAFISADAFDAVRDMMETLGLVPEDIKPL